MEDKEIKTTFDGNVTEEQVNRWKAQNRKVIRIDVVDGDECHVGYFKRPSLETMGAVAKVAKTDDLKSMQVLFDGCWLGGSEYLRTDASLFVECGKQLNLALTNVMGSLKNL